MKVYTCNEFKGYWSVPVAAIIIASNAEAAVEALVAELTARSLFQKIETVQLEYLCDATKGTKPQCKILSDGNY